jgi:hypothetical protein
MWKVRPAIQCLSSVCRRITSRWPDRIVSRGPAGGHTGVCYLETYVDIPESMARWTYFGERQASGSFHRNENASVALPC